MLSSFGRAIMPFKLTLKLNHSPKHLDTVWCQNWSSLSNSVRLLSVCMRRPLSTVRIHFETMSTHSATFIPHLYSTVPPLTHMSSCCPGNDTIDEAKLCHWLRTCSLSRSLPQTDSAPKPHRLGHKPQPGCTVDTKQLMEHELYVRHAYTLLTTAQQPASRRT